MELIHSLHRMSRAWLFDAPLSPYVEAFQAQLERGRYADASMDKALRLVALRPLDDKVSAGRLCAEHIDEALVDQFLDSHLPRCDCHASALRTHGDLRASLSHLLAMLREQHVIVELPCPSGPTAEELSRYNAHMRDACGLAIRTREDRLTIVSRLLSCKFGGRDIAISELQPDDVRGFIATDTAILTEASAVPTKSGSTPANVKFNRLSLPPEIARRADFRVGNRVTFVDKKFQHRVGLIVRVNQHTATLDSDGQKWRGAFDLLRHLVDV